MHYSFLAAYQQAQRMTQPATGLWLLHGDEILLNQWLLQCLTLQWQQHQMAITHMEITSAKSWHDILAELNSLSLFDEAKTIIAQGNAKPDKESLAQLQIFATQNSANCLIVMSDKYDKKSQASAFYQLCEKHGQVIDCYLWQDKQRDQLLAEQAKNFGLSLTSPAWQLLLAQTQNNLLSAYQSLWRLSYLYPTASDSQQAPTLSIIDVEQLQDGLVNQSTYTTFDLSDAMLAGQVQQVITILQALKQAQEPESLVLWVIAKDMRQLQSLYAGASYQNLGIWQTKQALYQQAQQRHTTDTMAGWSDLLYRCDQAIKGIINQPAWELLTQAALQVCGVKLFQAS